VICTTNQRLVTILPVANTDLCGLRVTAGFGPVRAHHPDNGTTAQLKYTHIHTHI